MCDFCCGKHQIDIYTNKSKKEGIEEYVYIDKNVLAIEVHKDTGGFSTVIRQEVCFCPMCGRRL